MSKKPTIHDWIWDEGDPEEIWYLEEEIAAGMLLYFVVFLDLCSPK
jgi:hypothetical protein